MEWATLPLKRYAEFTGRSRRKEYWMFVLLNALLWGAWYLVAIWGGSISLWTSVDTEWMLMPFLGIAGLYSLAAFIPGLAVTVRRLHDTDRSGWSILYGLIPAVGGLILLYFYIQEGTRGANRFGPDPKAEGQAAFA